MRFLLTSTLDATYILLCVFAIIAYTSSPLYDAPQHPLYTSPDGYVFWPNSSLLEEWIVEEEQIALKKLLANVAPDGHEALDAVPGTVIASPSRYEPDYYYQWTRDSAISMSTLLDILDSDTHDQFSSKLLHLVAEYAKLQPQLQQRPNPSGTFDDLSSLGEPKFHADGTAFTSPWGRPQHDGPALRAITLIEYVHRINETEPLIWQTAEGRRCFATLYSPTLPVNSTIKADLEYTSHFWEQPGFDLWEEAQGFHFYTVMVQHRALRDGMVIAAAFEDWGARKWCQQQADRISNELLPRFWDHEKDHLVGTLNTDRSGLDCGVLLAALHTTSRIQNASDSMQTLRFKPWSSQILSTLKALVEDQKTRYPINAKRSDFHGQDSGNNSIPGLTQGVAIGRYPEDKYNGYQAIPEGGNPWFICTNAVAETVYRTAEHLLQEGELPIAELETPFWKTLLMGMEFDNFSNQENAHSIPHPFQLFDIALDALMKMGDSYLEVVRMHAGADGAMSEQIHRITGYQTGARDLTWSYSSLLSAVRARGAVMTRLEGM